MPNFFCILPFTQTSCKTGHSNYNPDLNAKKLSYWYENRDFVIKTKISFIAKVAVRTAYLLALGAMLSLVSANCEGLDS